MDCPKCGYAMSPFDVDCPRCKRMGERTADPATYPVAETQPLKPPWPPTPAQCPPARDEAASAAPSPQERAPASPNNTGAGWVKGLQSAEAWRALTPEQRRTAILPIVALIVIGGVALGLVMVGLSGTGVTMEQFQSIHMGMTKSEVFAILGPGELVSGADSGGIVASMYQWKGRGELGANMNVMFVDGKAETKAQYGLR